MNIHFNSLTMFYMPTTLFSKETCSETLDFNMTITTSQSFKFDVLNDIIYKAACK